MTRKKPSEKKADKTEWVGSTAEWCPNVDGAGFCPCCKPAPVFTYINPYTFTPTVYPDLTVQMTTQLAQLQSGWLCPRCNKVVAPTEKTCPNC